MARRNTRTERRCPDCEGAGSITVRHGSGNPELEIDDSCPNLECVSGWIRWAPVDPLLLLAAMRKDTFYRTTGRYQNMLARVAVPVKLPHDFHADPLFRQASRDCDAAIRNFRGFETMLYSIFGQRAA